MTSKHLMRVVVNIDWLVDLCPFTFPLTAYLELGAFLATSAVEVCGTYVCAVTMGLATLGCIYQRPSLLKIPLLSPSRARAGGTLLVVLLLSLKMAASGGIKHLIGIEANPRAESITKGTTVDFPITLTHTSVAFRNGPPH